MDATDDRIADPLELIDDARRAGEDPARRASTMLAAAVAVLVYLGGKDAAEEVLSGIIARVRAGRYPEPKHPPGNA